MIPSHIHWWTHWEAFAGLLLKLLAKFGLIPGAAAGMGARKFYQKRRQRKAMESWPAVEANILYAHTHSEGPKAYWAELTYSYYVDEYRSGTYVRRFKREEEAEEFIAQIKGKRLQARYNRVKPDESVMLDHDIEMQVVLTPQIC